MRSRDQGSSIWRELHGDAAIGAVGAGGKVGDAEGSRGNAEDGFWRGHAVDHADDFELGLEFVRDEIDDKISFADCLFDGGGELQGPGLAVGVDHAEGFAEAGGQDILKHDAMAGMDGFCGK